MKLSDIRVGKENDSRRKLTDEDVDKIKEMYNKGVTIHDIAREFKGVCTRRTIQFKLFPERDKKLKQKRSEEKGHLKYYNKDKHREYMRKHRAKLKAIRKQNETDKT